MKSASPLFPVLRVLALGAALVAFEPAEAHGQETPGRTIQVSGGAAREIQFTDLGTFRYQVIDLGTGATLADIETAKTRDQVPTAIKALHGQRVALTGYLLPLRMEGDLATEVILMKDVTTCCYGAVPQMNDYAVVTMKGKPLKVVQDVPVTLVGTLEVGEKYDEGYLVSLFRMQSEGFASPGS